MKRSKTDITFNKSKPARESNKRHEYDKHRPGQMVPLRYPDRYKETQDKLIESLSPTNIPLLSANSLYDPAKKMGDYPVFDMPVSDYIPQTIKVRPIIQECRWFEKGTVRESGSKDLTTSYRHIKIKPSELKESFDQALGNLKESRKKERLLEDMGELQESGSTFDAFDYGCGGSAPTGPGTFLPLPPNDLMVQQYIRDFWLQAAESRWLYNNFGPIKGGIGILAAFVLGDGAKFKFNDKESQQIWNEFETREKLQGRLYNIGLGLFIYGERLLQTPEVLVNNLPGYVRLWDRNPANCWEIITDTNDFSKRYAYYFNYPTRWLLQTIDNVPTMKYIVEMVPPDEIVHVKINSLEDEIRGRSQIQAALSDSKTLQDYINARLIKAYNSAALVIDHKIEGDSGDVAAAALQEQNLIVPGAIVTHNDSESYDIIKGDTGNDAKSGLYGELLTQIALALGLPPVYLGAGEGGGRAQALSQTDPATKNFNTIRGILEEAFQSLANRVITIAKKHGRASSKANPKVEIIWPELTSENIESKITMLLQAQANGTLDHQAVSEAIAKELDNTNYDYSAAQVNIAEQIKKNPKLDDMFYVPPGSAPKQAPGGKTTTSKQQSENQAHSAYQGATMGLGNDNKRKIAQSLEAMAIEIGRLKESLGNEAVKPKQAKQHIYKGLRSRTTDTVLSETIPSSTVGALLPKMQLVEESYTDINKKMEDSNFIHESEATPPGWEDTVLALKGQPGIDNPYALVNWMDQNGYTPHQSEQDALDSVIQQFNRMHGSAWANDNAIESAPPGFPEDLMYKLKAQYPGDPSTAFAAAWQIRSNGYA